MTKYSISRDRAYEILDAYGASCERWPEDERQALQEMIDHDSTLTLAWEEAQKIDKTLDDWSAFSPRPGKIEQLLKKAEQAPRHRSRWWASGTAAAFLGVFLIAGYGLMDRKPGPSEGQQTGATGATGTNVRTELDNEGSIHITAYDIEDDEMAYLLFSPAELMEAQLDYWQAIASEGPIPVENADSEN